MTRHAGRIGSLQNLADRVKRFSKSRGSSKEVFEISRVGSGKEVFRILRVESGRLTRFSKSHGSGWARKLDLTGRVRMLHLTSRVGSGRVRFPARVGSRGLENLVG